MNIFKLLTVVVSLFVLAVTASGTANAITIGTYTPGSYLQSGSFTNLNTSLLTGVIIDLGVDAGAAGQGTPVWDTNNGSYTGTPTGAFSNLVPGSTDNFFTVSFLGLNITNGNSFAYSGLDYDGFTGASINGGGATLLDGSELVTLLFANGNTVSALLPAGSSNSVGTLLFDDSNLVTGVSVVPLPAALPLYGAGIAVLGFMGWRRKRKTSAAA